MNRSQLLQPLKMLDSSAARMRSQLLSTLSSALHHPDAMEGLLHQLKLGDAVMEEVLQTCSEEEQLSTASPTIKPAIYCVTKLALNYYSAR